MYTSVLEFIFWFTFRFSICLLIFPFCSYIFLLTSYISSFSFWASFRLFLKPLFSRPVIIVVQGYILLVYLFPSGHTSIFLCMPWFTWSYFGFTKYLFVSIFYNPFIMNLSDPYYWKGIIKQHRVELLSIQNSKFNFSGSISIQIYLM